MSIHDDTVYRLLTEDVQHVAQDTLGRELTAQEIDIVADRLPDLVAWDEAIFHAISLSGIE